MFQKLYDWFKGLTTPPWLNSLCTYLLENVIIPTLTQIGKDAIALLEDLIVNASKKDWTNAQKFGYVIEEFRESWGGDKIKDHILNLVIELLISQLKVQGII